MVIPAHEPSPPMLAIFAYALLAVFLLAPLAVAFVAGIRFGRKGFVEAVDRDVVIWVGDRKDAVIRWSGSEAAVQQSRESTGAEL